MTIMSWSDDTCQTDIYTLQSCRTLNIVDMLPIYIYVVHEKHTKTQKLNIDHET